MNYVGVDGCKAGWIGVSRLGGHLAYEIYPSIRALADAFPLAQRILVDIPIGLPWHDCPRRPCDELARTSLGSPRGSSVFAVPCREAVYAKDIASARALNMRELGPSLSEQTWGITPKIAEVDTFVRGGGTRMQEIHPEVCFWGLAGNKPMQYKKSLPQGARERLDLLSRFEPATASLLARAMSETRRKHLRADDILDAVVAFVTAEARVGTLSRLVGQPAVDCQGLPLEMLYVQL